MLCLKTVQYNFFFLNIIKKVCFNSNKMLISSSLLVSSFIAVTFGDDSGRKYFFVKCFNTVL